MGSRTPSIGEAHLKLMEEEGSSSLVTIGVRGLTLPVRGVGCGPPEKAAGTSIQGMRRTGQVQRHLTHLGDPWAGHPELGEIRRGF